MQWAYQGTHDMREFCKSSQKVCEMRGMLSLLEGKLWMLSIRLQGVLHVNLRGLQNCPRLWYGDGQVQGKKEGQGRVWKVKDERRAGQPT